MSDVINESEEAAAIRVEIDAARAILQKANATFQRKYKVLSKKYEMEMAKIPMTIEFALVSFLPEGENSRGYQYLQDLTWKGDWENYGLKFVGSSWNATNQRVLTILMSPSCYGSSNKGPEDWIEGTATRIEAVLPLIKPSALVNKDRARTKKYEGFKAFEVSGDDSEREQLIVIVGEDGLWGVVDTRSDYSDAMQWEISARPLREMLEALRARAESREPAYED